jgi:hypothetical protein
MSLFNCLEYCTCTSLYVYLLRSYKSAQYFLIQMQYKEFHRVETNLITIKYSYIH